MKIKGKKVQGAYEAVVVLPRYPESSNLVFKARAISDYEPFEKLCPEPKAPMIRFAGSLEEVENVEDVDYQKRFQEWAEFKSAWMIIQSLKATPDLEWETVDMGDHTTWKNYKKEMSDSDISVAELSRIILCVSQANGLDQTKIDEATESFLADQAARARNGNSLASVQPVMPSGEPASD